MLISCIIICGSCLPFSYFGFQSDSFRLMRKFYTKTFYHYNQDRSMHRVSFLRFIGFCTEDTVDPNAAPRSTMQEKENTVKTVAQYAKSDVATYAEDHI